MDDLAGINKGAPPSTRRNWRWLKSYRGHLWEGCVSLYKVEEGLFAAIWGGGLEQTEPNLLRGTLEELDREVNRRLQPYRDEAEHCEAVRRRQEWQDAREIDYLRRWPGSDGP